MPMCFSPPEQEFEELLRNLTDGIHVVPSRMYHNHFEEALSIAPHKEDSPYFALALVWDLPIWSNDKGFKNQNSVQVFNTLEFGTFCHCEGLDVPKQSIPVEMQA